MYIFLWEFVRWERQFVWWRKGHWGNRKRSCICQKKETVTSGSELLLQAAQGQNEKSARPTADTLGEGMKSRKIPEENLIGTKDAFPQLAPENVLQAHCMHTVLPSHSDGHAMRSFQIISNSRTFRLKMPITFPMCRGTLIVPFFPFKTSMYSSLLSIQVLEKNDSGS